MIGQVDNKDIVCSQEDVFVRTSSSAVTSTFRRYLNANLIALSFVGCSAHDNKEQPKSAHVESYQQELTISDLNPPRAPLVLPFTNGQVARVTQGPGGEVSHSGNATAHAVDFTDNTFQDFQHLALTPITGRVTRSFGHCTEGYDGHHEINNQCNGGWGNLVEIEARDGSVYIFGHCDSYAPEAPDGAFVLQGTPVCRIGSTGNSTGIHSHFDKVEKLGPARYRSLGVSEYITMKRGDSEPSIISPDEFAQCCNSGCESTPASNTCARYISFNRSLTDTLESFAREVQPSDMSILHLDGPLVVDEDLSRQYSPLLFVHHDATALVDGQEVNRRIYFKVTSPSEAGQRNPFIDTAFSFIGDPASEVNDDNYHYVATHTQVHTPRFVNFDLWDLARSALGTEIPFTQEVREVYDWDPEFELWTTAFEHDNTLRVFIEAVYKANKSYRFGAYQSPAGEWNGWYVM